MENKKKFKLQLPHVYTLAFILIIVFAILTWILPSGQFDRQLIDTAAGEREVAVAGTYHVIDKVSEWHLQEVFRQQQMLLHSFY